MSFASSILQLLLHRIHRLKLRMIRLVKEKPTCDHDGCDESAVASDIDRSEYWCWVHEPPHDWVRVERFTDLSDYEWKWSFSSNSAGDPDE